MTMKAQVEAMRAVAYVATAAFDKTLRQPDAGERRKQHELLDLLTPVVKGWCTELGVEIASTGVQVHGGMGYIEETGASQHLRDARITTIYEGTTGIQANDLVGRKIVRDQGQGAKRLIETMQSFAAELDGKQDDVIEAIRTALVEGIDAMSRATDWILAAHARDPRLPAAASVPYLRLFGTVVGGWQMARAALVARHKLDAGAGDSRFYQAKLTTARFYAEHIMPQARALLHAILQGSEATLALDTDQF